MIFAMMSGRKKRDYKAVLKAVRGLLPEDICLKEVLIDFESALWGAVAAVFPGISIKGCCFHWKQAVWRKIQEYGLQAAYMEQAKVYKFLQDLMALPFLPAELIPGMFESMRRKAGSPTLQRVFTSQHFSCRVTRAKLGEYSSRLLNHLMTDITFTFFSSENASETYFEHQIICVACNLVYKPCLDFGQMFL